MSNYSGSNFTNFQNVNLRGTAGNPGVVRSETASGFATTVSFSTTTADANYAVTLPNKTGGIGITGTFFCQLGVVAGGYAETMVTITGLRREDAFFAAVRDLGGTTVTASTRTYPILIGARPENGYAYLTFYNPTGTSTVFTDLVLGYTAYR